MRWLCWLSPIWSKNLDAWLYLCIVEFTFEINKAIDRSKRWCCELGDISLHNEDNCSYECWGIPNCSEIAMRVAVAAVQTAVRRSLAIEGWSGAEKKVGDAGGAQQQQQVLVNIRLTRPTKHCRAWMHKNTFEKCLVARLLQLEKVVGSSQCRYRSSTTTQHAFRSWKMCENSELVRLTRSFSSNLQAETLSQPCWRYANEKKNRRLISQFRALYLESDKRNWSLLSTKMVLCGPARVSLRAQQNAPV